MSLPTASKMSIALRCQYPWAEGVTWVDTPPGEAAERGTRIHAAVAKILDPNAPDHDASEDEVRIANAAAAAIQSLCPVDAATDIPVEVTFAYDPVEGRGRVIGQHLGRDYSKVPAGWLTGTADVVWVDGNVVNVLDVKTGSRANTQPAHENDQLRALAVYACTAYACNEAVVHLLFAGEDGILVESARLTHEALFQAEQAVYDMYARLGMATVDASPGAHCKWCPAKAACPEVSRVETALVPTDQRLPVVTEAASIQGPDHAAYLLAMVRAVRDKADLVEQALKAYADEHGGIPMGNKTWAKREAVRESIEVDDFSIAALRKVLGHHADDAVSMTSTKSAVAKAAKALAAEKGLKAKDIEAEAMEALRNLGAVKTTAFARYEEK